MTAHCIAFIRKRKPAPGSWRAFTIRLAIRKNLLQPLYFFRICADINTDQHMSIDFLRLETECENFPERLLQQFSLFSREDFPTFFQQLRQSDPEKAVRACIRHLSDKGADDLGR